LITQGYLSKPFLYPSAYFNEHEVECVVFRNDGDSTLDLSGWTISDEASRTYTVLGGVTLASGETITLRTGSGADTDTDPYWGSGSPVWNNGGETVTVTMPDGTEVLSEAYS
jgi:competence protein ComEC